MKDNWQGLLLFGAGILGGVVLFAMLPGMPWSAPVITNQASVEAADLMAQRQMAAAAWYMVVVTGVALAVNVVTLWFLWRNLTETQLARAQSERGVIAAEVAAAAAQEGAKSSRDLAMAQLRAYPIVDSCKIAYFNELLLLTTDITNSGQSPALRTSATVTLSWIYFEDGREMQRSIEQARVIALPDVKMQGVVTRDLYFKPKVNFGPSLNVRRVHATVHIHISYMDVFGLTTTSDVVFSGDVQLWKEDPVDLQRESLMDWADS